MAHPAPLLLNRVSTEFLLTVTVSFSLMRAQATS
jgi:hypothetical protein